MPITGFATAQGTGRYAERLGGAYPQSAYREQQGLRLSNVGVGTYLGPNTDERDKSYEEAITKCLLGGINVVDTAINYRCQRSERVIGKVLKTLIGDGKLARDEVFLSTKVGFVPFNNAPPQNPVEYFKTEFIDKNIADRDDLVAGCHVMTPHYIENQLTTSLTNLDVDCIDLYYLHNPETQLTELSGTEFSEALREVFTHLEGEVAKGRIRCYGTATWEGYRVAEGAREYLNLASIIATAKEVAGNDHHFRYIQLPMNLVMAEGWRYQNQRFGDATVSTLELCEKEGLLAMASGSIFQGRLSKNLPTLVRRDLGDFSTDAQRSLNFSRSVPGIATALVGMSTPDHVEENLEVLKKESLPVEMVEQVYARPGRNAS